jgi:hypothetical protein
VSWNATAEFNFGDFRLQLGNSNKFGSALACTKIIGDFFHQRFLVVHAGNGSSIVHSDIDFTALRIGKDRIPI